MKKLTRTACLIAILALSGVASAAASPAGYCYYDCGGEIEEVWTSDVWSSCCGSQYQCPNGYPGHAVWWEDYYGNQDACLLAARSSRAAVSPTSLPILDERELPTAAGASTQSSR